MEKRSVAVFGGLFLLVVVVLAVVGVVVSRIPERNTGIQTAPPPAAPAAAQRTPMRGGPAPGERDAYAPPESNTTKLHELPAEALDVNSPPEIGARTTTLSAAPGKSGIALRLKIKNTPRCMFGDLDIINGEMRLDPGAKLLLSLEPFLSTGSGSPIAITELSKENLERQVPIVFDLQPTTQPALLGLYICKDSNGAGACSGKTITDIARPDWLEAGPGAKPGDKIYFFAPMLLQNDRLTLVRSKLDDQGYSSLMGYLTGRLAAGQDARQMTGRLRSLLDTIRSATAMVEGLHIALDLPVLKRSMCGQMNLPDDLKQMQGMESSSNHG